MTLRQAWGKNNTLFLLLLALAIYPEAARGAGFAKDPLFLSRSPVTEGQTVRLFAVLSNSDTTAFNGTVVFYDGTTKIGSVTVSLAAGASITASVTWTPSAGDHNVKADIVGKDGTQVEEIKEAFTINSKPKPATPAQSSSAFSTSSIQSQYAAATIDSSAFI